MYQNSKQLAVLVLLLLSLNALGQFGNENIFWGNDLYRSGRILNFEKEVDGKPRYQASNEKVNNVIFNVNLDYNGIYSRVDFSLIQLALFNQDQNQHWSYNLTLGAFLNDEPYEWGSVRMMYGAGIDLDLSTFVINDLNGERVSFESGTIGLNVRVDLELYEFLIIKNSITRGWWNPDNSTRWDIRSTVYLEIFEGLYLNASPNYQSLSLDIASDTENRKEQSTHFYISYGISYVFFL